jgi:hypothetical protein
MKNLLLVLSVIALTGCGKFEDSIIINKPTIPSINFCEYVADETDVSSIKYKIESQAFKDERMQRAKFATKGYCFLSSQVIKIMESMVFADAKLEIAKELYKQTTDKKNYDSVIDSLVYKSDREELITYINSN